MTSRPASSPATIHPTAPVSRTIQVSSLWIPPASLVDRHLPGLGSFPSQPEPHSHRRNYSLVLYSHSLTTHTSQQSAHHGRPLKLGYIFSVPATTSDCGSGLRWGPERYTSFKNFLGHSAWLRNCSRKSDSLV